jgi:hypothetical protein
MVIFNTVLSHVLLIAMHMFGLNLKRKNGGLHLFY